MFWWDESLSTGIKNMDEQHKSIFQKAGEILDLDISTDLEVVNRAFIFLMNYSVNHFSEEEQRMIELGYEDFIEHRAQHNYYIDELYRISKSVKNLGINEDDLDSLKLLVIDWLANHIHESDKKFISSIGA